MELYLHAKDRGAADHRAARRSGRSPRDPAQGLHRARHGQEFLADAEKSNLEVAPISGEAVDKVIALIAATPPEVAERFTAATTSSGQMR